MKKLMLLLSFLIFGVSPYAQQVSIELTFTAQTAGQYSQLDSIRVVNIDQGGDTILYYPDSNLTLYYTIAGDVEPVNSQTASISIEQDPSVNYIIIRALVPDNNPAVMTVTDISGRLLSGIDINKGSGVYNLKLVPGNNDVYIICLASGKNRICKKIVNILGIEGSSCELIIEGTIPLMTKPQSSVLTLFPFFPGDSLRFVGYKDSLISLIYDAPIGPATYTFQFIPQNSCPGLSSFIYGGQVYHTVQIGTQCWMRENFNIGTIVSSVYTAGVPHSDVSNNGIIEKYCYDNNPANCEIYGAFYDWDEMMVYDSTPGIQGICPSGWHIPTDQEFCTLTTFLDPDVNCELVGDTIGTVAGGKMKEVGYNTWNPPNAGATNESGFTSLGTGYRSIMGHFLTVGNTATYWTSSKFSAADSWFWSLAYSHSRVNRLNYGHKNVGFSVRCIRN